MDSTTRIALSRLGALVAPVGTRTPAVTAAFLAELAHVGVRLENPEMVTDTLVASYRDIVKEVRALRGEQRSYAPLFKGFPEKLPTYDDLGLRLTLAAARLAGTQLTDDDVAAALDFSSLGFWPASSVPLDVEQNRLDRLVQDILPKDSRTQWMTLRVVPEADLVGLLQEFVQSSLSSASSLRSDVRLDVEELLKTLGTSFVDVSQVSFRETRTMLLKQIWLKDPTLLTPEMEITPTDVLRLFADLSGQDVSLTDKVTYPRLSRRERRTVVSVLEGSSRLNELFKYRDLWLKIDRGLHVGEYAAPRLQEALSRLRDTRHDRTSVMSRFELLLKDDVPAAVELLRMEAPGILGRSLRRVLFLMKDSDRAQVLASLEVAIKDVPLRVVLAATKQVQDNGQTYPRVAFGKNGAPMRIDQPRGHLAVAADLQQEVLDLLANEAADRAAQMGSWSEESVYVDPLLGSVLLPEALRTTAPGLVQVERGSRLPLGDAAVLRLFVHWMEVDERSDLDLSCLALDEHFKVVSSVSWTNLGNGAMTHSGDVTSAPAPSGAEEFLDVTLDKARAREGWRYLVPMVLRYSGPSFSALAEVNVGWMLRDTPSASHATFDAKTVVNAFELSGSGRNSMPFLVDLVTNEVLYVDVYTGGSDGAMVERDGSSMADLVALVAQRKDLKTSVAELAELHATSRGARIVSSREEATITFGMEESDSFNALRPERILSELL